MVVHSHIRHDSPLAGVRDHVSSSVSVVLSDLPLVVVRPQVVPPLVLRRHVRLCAPLLRHRDGEPAVLVAAQAAVAKLGVDQVDEVRSAVDLLPATLGTGDKMHRYGLPNSMVQ